MAWYSPYFNNINLTLNGKSLTSRKLAEYENTVELLNCFSANVIKALSRYDIENLPETCDKRVIKESLLFHGGVAYFEKEGNLLALPCAPDGDVNINGDVKKGFVYGRNGYNQKIGLHIRGAEEASLLNKTYSSTSEEPSGVYVRENEINYPFINTVISYASRTADAMRSLDVIRENIKTPYLVTCEESVLPTVKQFFEDKKKNVDKIVSTGIFSADKVNILPIPVLPEALKSCTDLIEWYNNKYDEACGINNNANPDKKERLLVDEINANNESTNTPIEHIIDYLQEEHDYVNKLYGTNIKIIKRKESENAIQELDTESGSVEMES